MNDDPLVIAAIHEALAAVRHQLIVGPTVTAAARALAERDCAPFDAVLVDLDGGADCLALLNAVQTCCPRLPLIALVSSEKWLLKEEAFLRGASGLVDKPASVEEIASAVRQACGCAGQRTFPFAQRHARLMPRRFGGIRQ
ncbi:MAG: hypothetical protein ABS95_00370 [Verrucomicrobia bacterium SCN 57-15]|nr:MAG: hypothetical protein ABS95_00370 [Verrucomicrobia bacterium SCN 57-15]